MIVRSDHRRGGFTFLEMIISTSLFVILMTTMFAFYRTSLAQRDAGTTASQEAQLARVILERMAQEVRQAVASVPGYGPGVFGYEDRIEINTVTIPDRKLSEIRNIRDAKLPGQFDLEQIRYYIAWDEINVDTNGDPRAVGLVRRVNRTYLRDVIFADDNKEADTQDEAALAFKEELYSPEIKYLSLRYFDGATWWDKWELVQGNSLPQIVRITIGFIPELPDPEELDVVDEDFMKSDEDLGSLQPDRYSVFVRLPQADVFFGSRLSREASAFSESADVE